MIVVDIPAGIGLPTKVVLHDADGDNWVYTRILKSDVKRIVHLEESCYVKDYAEDSLMKYD